MIALEKRAVSAPLDLKTGEPENLCMAYQTQGQKARVYKLLK